MVRITAVRAAGNRRWTKVCRREDYGLEEGPEEREDECYREHLGKWSPETSYPTAQRERRAMCKPRASVASAKRTLKKPRIP